MPFEQITPRPFTPDGIYMYAPAAIGVYGLSNAQEWIYIGRSNDIRRALLEHLQDPVLRGKQPRGFVFEVCEAARCLSRQDRLVLEYEPICNRRLPDMR